MNINEFKDTLEYQDFIKENNGIGYLRIRAYGASEAIPIEGMNIVVSTIYNDKNIIFFEGVTDESGMIKRLELPTPNRGVDDLVIPKWKVYNIEATYDGKVENFKVNIYDDICVQQVINTTYDNLVRGYFYGG